MTPNPEELLKELIDRMRRIETKVTRILTGEGDKGVTNTSYKLDTRNGYHLEFSSSSLTMHQLAKIVENECIPREKPVAVYDNDRYMFTVILED